MFVNSIIKTIFSVFMNGAPASVRISGGFTGMDKGRAVSLKSGVVIAFDTTRVTMGNRAMSNVIREDFVNALKEMNTYIDVTVDDLMTLNHKAVKFANLREKESIPVVNLMTTNVVTIRPEAALSDAVRLMMRHKISGLPVVDDARHLAGILTEADLLRSIGLPSHSAGNTLWQTLEAMFSRHYSEFYESRGVVAFLMVEHVITVGLDASLHDVIETMKKHRIKRVVVCDGHKQVKGIVTRSNLVKVFFDMLTE